MDVRMATIERLLDHMLWADDRVAASLETPAGTHPEAGALYAHVLGAEEVWLARLRAMESGPVWPEPDPAVIVALRTVVRDGYAGLVRGLDAAALDAAIRYTNSAGRTFDSRVEDILHHVFLHGAYHRGQIAYLLRAAGAEPAPTDYIAFVRGAPAATRADARPARAGRDPDDTRTHRSRT